MHLTLSTGEKITATEGHPFMTTEGWRNAVMLGKGNKLLLKGGSSRSNTATVSVITDIRSEQRLTSVFNIEVANAHTYFVGKDGQLVHNSKNTGKYRECNKGWAFAEKVFDRITGGKYTQRGNSKVGQTPDGKTANLHSSSSKGTQGRPTIEVRNPDGSVSTKVRY